MIETTLLEPAVPTKGPIPKSAVTIYDVAEKAGVSAATVSRILAGFVVYKPETKARVEGFARELGYQPNQLAKKLALTRNRKES
jgi:LacI family transcriptional regulator